MVNRLITCVLLLMIAGCTGLRYGIVINKDYRFKTIKGARLDILFCKDKIFTRTPDIFSNDEGDRDKKIEKFRWNFLRYSKDFGMFENAIYPDEAIWNELLDKNIGTGKNTTIVKAGDNISDSISYLLIINNLTLERVYKNESSSMNIGGKYYGGGTMYINNLNYELTFSLWDNKAKKTIAYGRIASWVPNNELAWESLAEDIADYVFHDKPYGRPSPAQEYQ
jgi:hypothetical protein